MRKMNFVGARTTDSRSQTVTSNTLTDSVPADRVADRMASWVLCHVLAEGQKLTVPQTLECCQIIDALSAAGVLPLTEQGTLRSLVWESAQDGGKCYYDGGVFCTLLRKIYAGVYTVQTDGIEYWEDTGKRIDAAIKHSEISQEEYDIATSEIERANTEIQNTVCKAYGHPECVRENRNCIGYELKQVTEEELQRYQRRAKVPTDATDFVPERKVFSALALSIADVIMKDAEQMQEELQKLNQEVTNLYITNKLTTPEHQVLSTFCVAMMNNPLYSNRLGLRGVSHEAAEALRDYALWYGHLKPGEMFTTVVTFENMFEAICQRNQSGTSAVLKSVDPSVSAYIPVGLTNSFKFFRRLSSDSGFCVDIKF